MPNVGYAGASTEMLFRVAETTSVIEGVIWKLVCRSPKSRFVSGSVNRLGRTCVRVQSGRRESGGERNMSH